MLKRFVPLAALALSLGSAGLAGADNTAQPAPVPTPVNLPTVPPETKVDPYARAAINVLTGAINQQIQRAANSTTGQVSYFKRFEMQVQTGRNSFRDIHLHQGTVINPRGATIAVGQHVEVGGVAQSDGSLNANVITIDQ